MFAHLEAAHAVTESMYMTLAVCMTIAHPEAERRLLVLVLRLALVLALVWNLGARVAARVAREAGAR